MNQRALIAAAAASLLSTLLVATPAVAQEKEKCYGISKAGQNDCANLNGSLSCAGQAKVSDGCQRVEIRGQRHVQQHERPDGRPGQDERHAADG